jgi:hypothetical protein
VRVFFQDHVFFFEDHAWAICLGLASHAADRRARRCWGQVGECDLKPIPRPAPSHRSHRSVIGMPFAF